MLDSGKSTQKIHIKNRKTIRWGLTMKPENEERMMDMKRKAVVFLIMIGIGTVLLTGCEKESRTTDTNLITQENADTTEEQDLPETTAKKVASSDETEATGDAAGEETSTEGNLTVNLDDAAMTAHVVEFSDSGCTVTQDLDDGNGELTVAAPGADGVMEHISVIYGEQAEFYVAVLNGNSISSVTDSDREEVKKETQLALYGTFEGSGTFRADKIVIMRYE